MYIENNEGTQQDFVDEYSSQILGGGSIFDQIGRGIETLWKTIINFFTSLLDILNPFSDNFFLKQLCEAIATGFNAVCTAIGNIASAIGNAIGNVLQSVLQFLFIPQQSSVDNLVNSVTSKFGFVDSLNTGISQIQSMLQNNTNLPVFTLNLPQNDWYNGEVTILDLNWYAPYKQYGDIVIAAFIYVFFAWRMYIKLSDIINGVGGSIDNSIQNGSIINISSKNQKNNNGKG